ncbi:hypothetical protein T4D_10087 [Trichinella pseudospiralis]|uniref:Uncharacterized protein n=1 Tax=Trichinella pseudospiralis TaxID=6337 RepID=A0A0V1FP01_TRIPS|nr:hypothetical protein T4D_10087 [Trichinella pseudospiralis]
MPKLDFIIQYSDTCDKMFFLPITRNVIDRLIQGWKFIIDSTQWQRCSFAIHDCKAFNDNYGFSELQSQFHDTMLHLNSAS